MRRSVLAIAAPALLVAATAQVAFFVDGTSIGVDTAAAYEAC